MNKNNQNYWKRLSIDLASSILFAPFHMAICLSPSKTFSETDLQVLWNYLHSEVKKKKKREDSEQCMYNTCIIDLKGEKEHVQMWFIYS